MRTDYKKISKTNWNRVNPIKINNPEPNQVYVNEYIADGSKIGKDSFLLYCRLGDDIVVDSRCFAGDYLIVGDNVIFKYNPTIGDHCVFGNNVYFHKYGQIGSHNEFGNNARFNENITFKRYNIFGDGVRFEGHNKFHYQNEIGDNAKVGLSCELKSVKFGNNAQLNHPHFYGEAEFGDGAELFSPYFKAEFVSIHFGDDAKIYLDEDILSRFRHLLPKHPDLIHPGARNNVFLVQRTDFNDCRKTKKKENIKKVYSLKDFLSLC